MAARNPWIGFSREVGQPALRLVFFPFAGGAAHAYRPVVAHLPATVSAYFLELPGRGTRYGEPPIESWPALVAGARAALQPLFQGAPVAFFGHSFGAKIAHAVTAVLAAGGATLPKRLFLSGSGCPMQPRAVPRGSLPEGELVAMLRRMGGTPGEVLDDPEFRALFIPPTRADLHLNDTYDASAAPPLPVPMTAFYGTMDEDAGAEAVERWRTRTSVSFESIAIQGRHFFVLEQAKEVMARAFATL